jgi:hypothetical protein
MHTKKTLKIRPSRNFVSLVVHEFKNYPRLWPPESQLRSRDGQLFLLHAGCALIFG